LTSTKEGGEEGGKGRREGRKKDGKRKEFSFYFLYFWNLLFMILSEFRSSTFRGILFLVGG
jgi:hypothetical protein